MFSRRKSVVSSVAESCTVEEGGERQCWCMEPKSALSLDIVTQHPTKSTHSALRSVKRRVEEVEINSRIVVRSVIESHILLYFGIFHHIICNLAYVCKFQFDLSKLLFNLFSFHVCGKTLGRGDRHGAVLTRSSCSKE